MACSLCFMLLVAVQAVADFHLPDQYELDIRERFRAGDWKGGKAILDEAMKLYGDLATMNELMGWYYFSKDTIHAARDCDNARYYLTRALREDPRNEHALDLMIGVEEYSKNYSSAICYINERLKSNPYSRGLWRRKIFLYHELGNEVEADRLLTRLRQIYPQDTLVAHDYKYRLEINLKRNQEKGNIDDQIEVLRQLIIVDPKNPNHYNRLASLLQQQGKSSEAAEVAAEGARLTNNTELVRKRIGILLEQGRYAEARNYLAERKAIRNTTELMKLEKFIDSEAARNSVLNDPYIMYGRVYENTRDREALNFLINTALSRGYYDDALGYLKKMRKVRGDTEDLLYKTFMAQRRLGDTRAATATLEALVAKYPKNTDAIEELCALYFEAANRDMQLGMHSDALPLLTYAVNHSTDSTLLHAARLRRFTCLMETENYTAAAAYLDSIRTEYPLQTYMFNKAMLLRSQNREAEALDMLAVLYSRLKQADSVDVALCNSVSGFYEELSAPFIKRLIGLGMINQAYDQVRRAVDICPTSYDLLNQAIGLSNMLKRSDDHHAYVERAMRRYPDDPHLIVKYANILALDEKFDESLDILRPMLDTYIGDSVIVRAFTGNSELYALRLRLDEPKKALDIVNTALIYQPTDEELLFTKGLIHEKLRNYDSAYIYQQHYTPTLMDYKEYKNHLEELVHQTFRNEIEASFQEATRSSIYMKTGNASLAYTRRYNRNQYTFTAVYAGRDAYFPDDITDGMPDEGGVGLQGGVSWTHRFKPTFSGTVAAAFATKYMPRWTFKVGASVDLRNDWTLDPHIAWRLVRSTSQHYVAESYYNEETMQVDTVISLDHWRAAWTSLCTVGLGVSKTIDQFVLSSTVDVHLLARNFFYSLSGKVQFFPVEGNRSHVFLLGGLGTAPEMDVVDGALPNGFNDLSTYIGMGGFYTINRHLAISLTGQWYTLSYPEVYPADMYTFARKTTSHWNYFFINGHLYISF